MSSIQGGFKNLVGKLSNERVCGLDRKQRTTYVQVREKTIKDYVQTTQQRIAAASSIQREHAHYNRTYVNLRYFDAQIRNDFAIACRGNISLPANTHDSLEWVLSHHYNKDRDFDVYIEITMGEINADDAKEGNIPAYYKKFHLTSFRGPARESLSRYVRQRQQEVGASSIELPDPTASDGTSDGGFTQVVATSSLLASTRTEPLAASTSTQDWSQQLCS